MGFYYFNASPKLYCFINQVDIYREEIVNELTIFINDKKSQMGYAETIMNLLSQNNISDAQIVDRSIAFSALSCRKVIDCLYRNGYISVEDRAEIEAEIRKIESAIEYRKKIVAHISNSQVDILNSLFTDLFIDEILEIADNPFNALNLINTVVRVSMIDCESSYDWDLYLIHKQKIAIEETAKQRLFTSLTGLARCYGGTANLESALEQNGSGIPNRSLQQKAIFTAVKYAFFNKFSDLDNTSRFFSILGFHLILLGYPIANIWKPSNLNDLDYFLDVIDILKSAVTLNSIPKHLKRLALIHRNSMPHDVFIKLLTDTMAETNLSLNEIAITARLRLIRMHQESLSFLSEIPVASSLKFFSYTLDTEIRDSTRHNLPITANHQDACRVKFSSVLKEIQHHQTNIQTGSFFGKSGGLAKENVRHESADAEAANKTQLDNGKVG